MPAVHHLNCASFRARFVGRLVAHCLLVERADGLLLVDTGFGSGDLARPTRLGRPFLAVARPALDGAELAVAQVRALGHDPADVTDIVLTHLDLDHVGGIGDFPQARVHVYAEELAAARRPLLRERGRYVPAQWAHDVRWVEHRTDGDEWFGFSAVTALDDDVVLVPLQGHTRGHAGVAVRRPAGSGWLLHAGDSYFHAAERTAAGGAPVTLRAYQRLMGIDDRRRKQNADRVRALHAAHGDEVTVFCAHDPTELERLSAAKA